MIAARDDHPAPTTIVPGRVYGLGGAVSATNGFSWLPEDAQGRVPTNAWLFTTRPRAVLVDTGVPAHRDVVLDQLASLVPLGAPLTVVLTRTEMDCVLNLPAIDERWDIDHVHMTGGINVPFRNAAARTVRHSVEPGTSLHLDLAGATTLELISPRLRMLPVVWPFDRESGTLCTSDLFLHSWAGDDDPAGDARADWRVDFGMPPSDKVVTATLLAKMGWITAADTSPMAADLSGIFAGRDVRAVAPTHGRAIVGHQSVAAHAAALQRAVGAAGRPS